MGWIGSTDRLVDVLSARADFEEIDGKRRYYVRPVPCFGIGGDEVVLSDDAEVRIDGIWVPLVPHMSGGVRVLVI